VTTSSGMAGIGTAAEHSRPAGEFTLAAVAFEYARTEEGVEGVAWARQEDDCCRSDY
jgi:hypothetical protein